MHFTANQKPVAVAMVDGKYELEPDVFSTVSIIDIVWGGKIPRLGGKELTKWFYWLMKWYCLFCSAKIA